MPSLGKPPASPTSVHLHATRGLILGVLWGHSLAHAPLQCPGPQVRRALGLHLVRHKHPFVGPEKCRVLSQISPGLST